MNPYLQEVLDAHVLIERWLSHGEGSAEALMKRFAADFTMIPLSGEKMDYPTVSRFFHHSGGSRPGLDIVVDQMEIISEWVDGDFSARGRENCLAPSAGNPPRLAQRKRPRLSRGPF